MAFFIVRMTHPEGEGWEQHAVAHVRYLRDLLAAGSLVASGPLVSMPGRAGFLIFEAAARAKVEALVAADPFSVADLVETLCIEQWDPLFGAFAERSSGQLAAIGPIG